MSSSKKQEIFGAAIEIEDKAERKAMLESACAGDLLLRAEIEELIETSAQAEGFFAECATAITASREELEPSLLLNGDGRSGKKKEWDLVGSTIGSYRLLEALCEGGCGVVYLAEQQK